MPILELTNDQVISLVRQLPPERQMEALLALAQGAQTRRIDRLQFAEQQLRRLSADRGRNWDTMSEDEREAFVGELVHEDRPCNS
jgi:hypothetical protein